jgi:hypothetical protein
MLTLITVAVGSFVSGLLIRSAVRASKDERCGHAWKGQHETWVDFSVTNDWFWSHCKARKDKQCQGDLCTAHCKSLCGGKCLL